MFNYIFHPEVSIELNNAINWYKNISIELSEKFKNEIKFYLLYIQKNPYLYQISYSDIRICNLKKIPFQIAYSISFNNIYVYSIFHKKRNPKIWKNRRF